MDPSKSPLATDVHNIDEASFLLNKTGNIAVFGRKDAKAELQKLRLSWSRENNEKMKNPDV